MAEKLTKAQLELLRLAATPERVTPGHFYPAGESCSSSYRPAQRLVQMGLARWRRDDPDTSWLLATDAGRAALNQKEDRGND